jgi:guanine deaminase
MADAIQVSKLRKTLVAEEDDPLTPEEAFYLGTVGGGAFFGKAGAEHFGAAGSFAPGYDFDALVIDDTNLAAPFGLSIRERLERVIYLSDDRNIVEKYVRGKSVFRQPAETTEGTDNTDKSQKFK